MDPFRGTHSVPRIKGPIKVDGPFMDPSVNGPIMFRVPMDPPADGPLDCVLPTD